MVYLLITLHVVVCIFLILVVLLQTGKGAEMGAAFGGSAQTMFGSRGAATLLSKLTTASAIIFMITSLSLAIISTKQETIIPEQPAATLDTPQGAPPTADQPAGGVGAGPVSDAIPATATGSSQTASPVGVTPPPPAGEPAPTTKP